MIWVNTNSSGERTVFQNSGADVRSMKVGKDNTETFVSLISRAKEWFAMGYNENWKKEL
jgi:hypothetical protein